MTTNDSEANNKMNVHLQHILDILQQIENLSEEQKAAITKSLKDADKELTITAFKLDRTEKVKRTTAILLEETIEELELKRKAVEESNLALQKSLEDLEAAKDQLVQQEKLASLGQLTAGIAHEIKNPLNFVNNFSEVSIEMVDEVREEVNSEIKKGNVAGGKNGTAEPGDHALFGKDGNPETILSILDDIEANLKTIHKHGTRADAIVKSMLQHSRGGSGKMEPANLNALVKEYVNLAFHGMRAGKEPINVDIDLQLDESVGDVPLIAEDFSRVILNLCKNGFDAMSEKLKVESDELKVYSPKLTVRTGRVAGGGAGNGGADNGVAQNGGAQNSGILIEIKDNGPGVPDDIKDKILQPFFTTKKGTAGTGLGLSITHDIIKAHGGELSVNTIAGQGTTFRIGLHPNNT